MLSGSKLVLQPGEHLVMISDKEVITLTNMRVRLDSTVKGKSVLVSMVLDSVASCGVVTRSNPLLLVSAAIAGLLGLVQSGDIQNALFVALVAFIVAYFLSGSAVLTITSTGGTEIVTPVSDMSRDQIVRFVDTLEREKINFLSYRKLLPATGPSA